MKAKYVILTGALVMAISGGVALAGSQYCDDRSNRSMFEKHGHRNHGSYLLEHIQDKLELSESQKEQLESIVAELGDNRMDVRKEVMTLRLEAMQLDPATNTFQSDLDELADEAASMARSKILQHGMLKQRVIAVLTAEQQAEFSELTKMHAEKMKERMKHHGSDHQDPS